MNYEGVGYNVETLANCVVGQLRSLVFRYKMFKLSWTKLDRNGPKGLKWTELDQIRPD